LVPEEELPVELSPFAAVEAAYSTELSRSLEALGRGLPVLIECEKEMVPYFYRCLRDRLKASGRRCLYLDGRPIQELPPPPAGMGLIGAIISMLRDAVRGAVGERIIVLPHLDLLTSTSFGGLTAEAREVIPLMYENPEILFLGFKDPSFEIPRTIQNLFPHRESIIGVPRDRLRMLVTQREARKFGRGLPTFLLYKHVSGVNAVRLRRLLSSMQGEDYPADPKHAFDQLRSATLAGELSVPDMNLERDIGGYGKVKERLRQEIIDVLLAKDRLADAEEVKRIEALIPRGLIFWGPPGTGKTLFAKAMASALGAAVQVVSGPELKSKWVGESEENLRRIFVQARTSAPAVIVFDELDSFAAQRGTYTGSGVEHSMVNQLLTEMDGFRKDELVFVVGTTNFVESLDSALLRPGRFEFHLHIPYPASDDRRAILGIYDKKLGLNFSPKAMDYAVKRTGDLVEGATGGTRYSGDHIQALCRQLARKRLRDKATKQPTEVIDVEKALSEYQERPDLTAHEERVVATHESGHAVAALFCPHSPPIDRISIRGDLAGALGFVQYADPAHRYVVTQAQLLDSICVLFGGREAETLYCEDLSIGSGSDLARATGIARSLVEEFGMGGEAVGARRFAPNDPREPATPLSDEMRAAIEKGVRDVLETQRLRARKILTEQKALVTTLRDMLIEKKVIDREAFAALVPGIGAVKEKKEAQGG
jgi:cell division protease FtsH